MAETNHIFLSYRSVEADFALKLAADLKNSGVRLWMDRLDGIQVGMDWREAIDQAIHHCAAMISVLSPDYIKSEYCKKELSRANTLQRPIFPLLLRPLKPVEIPFVLEGVQYEDFTDWMDEKTYHERFQILLRRLKTEIGSQVGEIPDEEVRYLTSLIAELEARRGVLEYVDLYAESETLKVRPEPKEDEWGFGMLLEEQASPVIERQSQIGNFEELSRKIAKFVLVGDPGAGKTTTLRRFARDAARKRLENSRLNPLPFLVYLPHWTTQATPQEFIQSHWPFSTPLDPLLKTGDVLLMMDGLNEMGADGPLKARLLREWLRSPSTSPANVIVTSRIEDYDGDLKLGNLPVITIQGLKEEQIRKFVRNYLQEQADLFFMRVKIDSATLADQYHTMHSLMQNPYLLSALMIVFQNSPHGDLPRNNGALFRALVRALWKREQERHTLGWIPYEEMESHFAKLAFNVIDHQMPVDFDITYARSVVERDELLRTARSANLIEFTGDKMRFYHQLMLEYFAAIGLRTVGITAKLSKVNMVEFYEFATSNELTRKRAPTLWDQVIIALCGLIPNPNEYLLEIAQLDPYLALLCLQSGIKFSIDYQNLFRAALSSDNTDIVREAIRVFSILRLVPDGIELLSDHYDEDVRISSISMLGRSADIKTVPIIAGALYDDSLQVQIAAVEALGRTGGERANHALVAFTSNNISKIRGQFELRSAIASRLALIKTDEARKLLEELVD